MRCYVGSGDDDELDALVEAGQLHPGDADAIRNFRDFLELAPKVGAGAAYVHIYGEPGNG
jgi:hypothetical protein